jgi:DNA-binding transcriptional LysR family regulator
VTHRFEDAFTLILPKTMEFHVPLPARKAERQDFLRKQSWMMIGDQTVTGQRLRQWMKRRGLEVESAMELDNFDLIINLVAMGLGVSIVPVRALALYNQKGKIIRVTSEDSFARELVVVTRKHRKMPEHPDKDLKEIHGQDQDEQPSHDGHRFMMATMLQGVILGQSIH